MDIKDLKKAGVSDAEEISIKETNVKTKTKETKTEEIKIKREPQLKFTRMKNFWKAIVTFFGAFWFIVWKDDSPKGWLISLIFIFIFIKFIFFPSLSFVTGTTLPLAIVESCSMYHDGNLLSSFNNWWPAEENKYTQFNITDSQFSKFIFKKGFNKGDILFVVGANPDKIKVGDVIIFEAGRQNPLIHRVMKITTDANGEKIFSTMGDNNNGQLSVEQEIHEEQLIGKANLKLAPYLGWVKLIFFEGNQPSNNKGFCN